MVQQAAPAKTVQTFEGYAVGTICTEAHGCVRTHAMFCLRLDADGDGVIACYDPNNPMRGFQSPVNGRANSEFVHQFLAELVKLSPTLP
jgi:hypothetical protein